MFEDFGFFLVIDSIFLLRDGTIFLLESNTVEKFFVSGDSDNIEVEFGSSCFKFLFKFKEDNDVFLLLLRGLLFLRPKHFITHLLIVSFLSLLKKSKSYFNIYIVSIRFQRPLIMIVNSIWCCFVN